VSGSRGGALAAVDHLLLAAPDLDAGIDWLAARTGARAAPGGSHPGKGTRNALAALGPRCYLEVLAPDPAQPDARSSLRDLTRVDAPTLARWAAVGRDLDAFAGRLRATAPTGVTVDGPLAGARTHPDGVTLRWRTLSVRGAPVAALGGVVPFFIEWDAGTRHPAEDAPPLGALTDVWLVSPDPDGARGLLGWLELGLPVEQGATEGLVARIATPRGELVLR
jgi:hypothetical protein